MKDEPILLQAAKRLDKDALTTIFDIYAPAIYKYALRLCHDPLESDNIVGDVFSALLDGLAVGKGPSTSLRSYLYQIAYHFLVDYARHSKRFIDTEANMDTSSKLTTSSQSQIEVLMESFVSALRSNLNELEQHVIILRFLEGFSIRETATIVSKSAKHVREIQKCGIGKLRKSFHLHFAKDKLD